MSVCLFYFISCFHLVHNEQNNGWETKENESQSAPSPRIVTSTNRIKGRLLSDPPKSEGIGRKDENEDDDTHEVWLKISARPSPDCS